MKTRRYSIAAGAILLTLAMAVPSQAITKRRASSVANQSRLEFGIGFRHHDNHLNDFGWNDPDFGAASEGAIGRVTLSHFADENLALTLSWSLHDVESDSWRNEYGDRITETEVAHSLMFGMRYYLSQSRRNSPVLPYFSAAAGPFFGSYEYSERYDCDCETYDELENETVMGARLGGGVDFRLGRSVMLGINGGYNFVEDFDTPVGGRHDYSGTELGVSFSWLFGH